MELQFHPDPARKLSAQPFGIHHCCVQRKTPDDGHRNYPKHVEFHSKNKFDKLVHIVCFILRNLKGIITKCGGHKNVFRNGEQW
jgi:hypothetical protein